MDGRFVLTPLLFVPEWLADAVAYWGSKRYLLKPAWLLQAGKGAAGEDDPVGYCVGFWVGVDNGPIVNKGLTPDAYTHTMAVDPRDQGGERRDQGVVGIGLNGANNNNAAAAATSIVYPSVFVLGILL